MTDEAGMTPPQPIQSVYSEEDLIEEGMLKGFVLLGKS